MKRLIQLPIFWMAMIGGLLAPHFLFAEENSITDRRDAIAEKEDPLDRFMRFETSAATDKNSQKKSSNSGAFVIATDDEMALESLNRIAGEIDLGFSAPESTFKSPDHYGMGPFAKERAENMRYNNPDD